MTAADAIISELADAGLLTERQAEAFVLRRVEAVRRPEAAEHMGIALSTLDGYVQDAEDKIESAEETVAILNRVRTGSDLPSECSECGATLGGSWIGRGEDAMCFDCAGVDRSEALPE